MQFNSVWSKETVINIDLNNKKKHYVKIDSTISSDKILALLEEVESDNEDVIENLMNDSDTEFIIEESVEKTIPEEESLSTTVLTPEVNIHVMKETDQINVLDDESTTGKKMKKIKKVNETFKWSERASPHVPEPCQLVAEVQIEGLNENHTPFDVFVMVTNRDLVKLIVDQTNLYAQQNGREFCTNEKEMLAFLGINYIMSINQLPTIQSYWECGQL